MKISEEIEKNGQWLFRHRSYLPLMILAGAALAFRGFHYFGADHEWQERWEVLCLAISAVGVLIRVWAIGQAPAGTSGRNTHGQVAEELNTTGIYSMVRHPLYLGNYLMWLGVAAVPHSFPLFAVVTLVFWLYHERIIYAEEAFLERKFGDTFRVWAARTPTFIPQPGLWKKSDLPFSWRHVLKREYLGVFALVTVFTLFEIMADTVAEGSLQVEWPWVMGWSLTAGAFVLIRVLAKQTSWLRVEGR